MQTLVLALLLGLLQGQDSGSIEGIVVNSVTGEPVADASVAFATYRATAGKDGRFIVTGVRPGLYNVGASQNGFFMTQPGPAGRPGAFPVSLTAAQQVKNLRLVLTPAASISGRVLDENKEPIGSASVSLVLANGGARWAATNNGPTRLAQANERGEYRIANVMPGRYYLRVGPDSSRLDFLPSFYPGTSQPAQAVPVDVSAGADLRGYDFSLAAGKKFSVRFKLGGLTPAPQGVRFNVRPVDGDWMPSAFLEPQIANGIYTLAGFAPGRYTIDATWSPPAPSHRERFTVEVVDKNVDLGSVVLTPGATIPVRIVADTPVPTLFRMETLRFSLQPWLIGDGVPTLITVAPDGTARVDGAPTGRFIPQVSFLPEGFYVASVKYGTRDVLDAGLDVDGKAAPSALEIHIASPMGTLDGVVRNATETAPSASIVLVPSAARRDNTSFYFLTLADQNGTYLFPAIPPGEYSVVAGSYSIADAFLNKALISEILPRTPKVTIARGSKQRVDVQTIPKPQGMR